ncbi:MAG TPA: DUF2007 domain-containing protein [Flavobacterium sp.]|nr:DUF2007 domain-containing protein [Flavobacterium sp.]
MEDQEFILLAETQYSSEALIYKGKLESEGIEVFIKDNFIVDSMPLYSNAVGGVKLFVRKENFGEAQKAFSQISRFSVDNTGKPVVCPNCGSHETDLLTTINDSKSFLAFVFSLLITVFPFYAKYKHKCSACGFEFEEK